MAQYFEKKKKTHKKQALSFTLQQLFSPLNFHQESLPCYRADIQLSPKQATITDKRSNYNEGMP